MSNPVLLYFIYRYMWIFTKNMRSYRALGILKQRWKDGPTDQIISIYSYMISPLLSLPLPLSLFPHPTPFLLSPFIPPSLSLIICPPLLQAGDQTLTFLQAGTRCNC